MRRVGLMILLGIATCPATASAATVSSSGGELHWVNQPGQEDYAYVAIEGDSYVLHNNQLGSTAEAGGGCTMDTVGTDPPVRCPIAGVQRIVIDLGSKNDSLNTSLPAGAAPVTLSGGTGRDTVYYDGPAPVTVSLDGIANDGLGAGHDNVMTDVETVSGTRYSGDRLTAGPIGSVLAGLGGKDTLTGGPGNDLIDAIDPVECSDPDESGCEKATADTVSCRGGKDVVDADSRDRVARDCEVVAVDSGVKLTPGNDRFTAFRSGLVVLGGRGNDRLSTGAWSDTIKGGPGNDRIHGGATSSDLTGGSGRDLIVSSDQFDDINVRDGEVDRVICGGGRDFVIADKKDKVAKDCKQVDRK